MPKPLDIDVQKNQKKSKKSSKNKGGGNDFWQQVGQLSTGDGSPSKK